MNNGGYNVIYADPPWRYDDATPNREVENHYPTMALAEICCIEVPADKNAVLYMWATAPKLLEAIAVMRSWGFRYRTHAVWDKEKMGMLYRAGSHSMPNPIVASGYFHDRQG
jgi:site-specific DNA-methyltransferase (adenine-specific)